MAFSLKRAFTENLGTKLASIFLSLVVFVHVYTEQEREWTMEVPLEIANISEDLCFVSAPPSSLLVTVRGKGKDLIKLRFKGARAVVDLAGEKLGRVKRILSGSDVLLPPELNVTVADVVRPKVLNVELDAKTEKIVRVVPRYSGSLQPGFALSGPPTVEPDRVQAVGARRVLAELDFVSTAPIDIAGIAEPRTVEAEVDAGSLYLNIEPKSVRVTFLVEKKPGQGDKGTAVAGDQG